MKRQFPDYLRTLQDPAGTPLTGPLREVVFHHQPKTAGSTFRQVLESLFANNEVCPAEIDDEVRALTAPDRERCRLYAGHYRYDTIAELFPDAIWLVMIRNPIDRVISNYYNLRDPNRYGRSWIRRAEERPKVKSFLAKVHEMSLEDFVFSDLNRVRDRVINRQTRYLVMREMHARQFPVYDEKVVEAAKRNLRERFHYVGVQEHFDLSLDLLLMTFGLPPIDDRTKFNTNINTREKSSRGYDIPDHVREYLVEQNQMDLEVWSYATSLMFEHLRAYQNFLLERDYVLRRELGVDGLPRSAMVEVVRMSAGHSFVAGLKRRMPRTIKKLLQSTLPSR